MAKIIQHQFSFPNPPEVVWEYLTDANLIAKWLMPGNFLPIVGHEFKLSAPVMPEMGFDGNIYCKVLVVEPFSSLCYSWKFGPGDGTSTTSVVNWTLTSKDGGTDLLLVHCGFEGQNFIDMFNSMNEGWPKHVGQILQILNK
ncbi:SRPBCC domain-containing protein [Mucilaginibacter sp. dw_454]|uniref:SRPBCC family protein n=1 Tax=Mucilaginibacter sp. dw_454 TaxID=2720079 RepID=UPI001BD5E730|nr:SRPBCC domain-containing protein [Mucilaginibacter sp. dw_454]